MLRNLAVLALAVLSGSPALAQLPPNFGRPPGPGSPGFQPAVSPYLNLARGGVPAVNYYGLVRPQVEGTQALINIEQQLQSFEPVTVPGMAGGPMQGAGAGSTVGPQVVAPTRFMTHGRNFQNAFPTQGAQPGGTPAITGLGQSLSPRR